MNDLIEPEVQRTEGNGPYWWTRAVFYEMYVDRFGGDFKGATERLDYLEKLGVDCIHLLPFSLSGGIDQGYDIVDHCSVRPELGSIDDAIEFIAAAKQRGIRVVIDLILNHVSTAHPWFKEALRDPAGPKRRYFLWSETGEEFPLATNPFYHLKPSNWIWQEEANAYHYSTFYPEQADLNWDEPAIFDEMAAIMDFWLDRGASGFRLDAVSHLVKREGTRCQHLPETHEIIKRLRARLGQKDPNIILIGEVNERYKTAKEYFGTGDECHLVYDFYLSRNIFLALASGDPLAIMRHEAERADIPENTQWAAFLRNHDDLSLHRLEDDERELLFRTFDPNETRRFGTGIASRLASMLKEDQERIREAFRSLFAATGSPVIYFGDELGSVDEHFEVPPLDTRLYCRKRIDWDTVNEQENDGSSLLSFMRGIVRAYHGK